jgi:hypothetical protein
MKNNNHLKLKQQLLLNQIDLINIQKTTTNKKITLLINNLIVLTTDNIFYLNDLSNIEENKTINLIRKTTIDTRYIIEKLIDNEEISNEEI